MISPLSIDFTDINCVFAHPNDNPILRELSPQSISKIKDLFQESQTRIAELNFIDTFYLYTTNEEQYADTELDTGFFAQDATLFIWAHLKEFAKASDELRKNRAACEKLLQDQMNKFLCVLANKVTKRNSWFNANDRTQLIHNNFARMLFDSESHMFPAGFLGHYIDLRITPVFLKRTAKENSSNLPQTYVIFPHRAILKYLEKAGMETLVFGDKSVYVKDIICCKFDRNMSGYHEFIEQKLTLDNFLIRTPTSFEDTNPDCLQSLVVTYKINKVDKDGKFLIYKFLFDFDPTTNEYFIKNGENQEISRFSSLGDLLNSNYALKNRTPILNYIKFETSNLGAFTRGTYQDGGNDVNQRSVYPLHKAVEALQKRVEARHEDSTAFQKLQKEEEQKDIGPQYQVFKAGDKNEIQQLGNCTVLNQLLGLLHHMKYFHENYTFENAESFSRDADVIYYDFLRFLTLSGTSYFQSRLDDLEYDVPRDTTAAIRDYKKTCQEKHSKFESTLFAHQAHKKLEITLAEKIVTSNHGLEAIEAFLGSDDLNSYNLVSRLRVLLPNEFIVGQISRVNDDTNIEKLVAVAESVALIVRKELNSLKVVADAKEQKCVSTTTEDRMTAVKDRYYVIQGQIRRKVRLHPKSSSTTVKNVVTTPAAKDLIEEYVSKYLGSESQSNFENIVCAIELYRRDHDFSSTEQIINSELGNKKFAMSPSATDFPKLQLLRDKLLGEATKKERLHQAIKGHPAYYLLDSQEAKAKLSDLKSSDPSKNYLLLRPSSQNGCYSFTYIHDQGVSSGRIGIDSELGYYDAQIKPQARTYMPTINELISTLTSEINQEIQTAGNIVRELHFAGGGIASTQSDQQNRVSGGGGSGPSRIPCAFFNSNGNETSGDKKQELKTFLKGFMESNGIMERNGTIENNQKFNKFLNAFVNYLTEEQDIFTAEGLLECNEEDIDELIKGCGESNDVFCNSIGPQNRLKKALKAEVALKAQNNPGPLMAA